jgi:hypothetical protein
MFRAISKKQALSVARELRTIRFIKNKAVRLEPLLYGETLFIKLFDKHGRHMYTVRYRKYKKHILLKFNELNKTLVTINAS